MRWAGPASLPERSVPAGLRLRSSEAIAGSSDDGVFLEDEEERAEYVMNEDGVIYKGSYNYISSTRWDYGQVRTEAAWTGCTGTGDGGTGERGYVSSEDFVSSLFVPSAV